jgi:hypothetical protein
MTQKWFVAEPLSIPEHTETPANLIQNGHDKSTPHIAEVLAARDTAVTGETCFSGSYAYYAPA